MIRAGSRLLKPPGSTSDQAGMVYGMHAEHKLDKMQADVTRTVR
jgi:hypothetical protein